MSFYSIFGDFLVLISAGGHFWAKIWAPDPESDISGPKSRGHLPPNLDLTSKPIVGGPEKTLWRPRGSAY